MRTDIRKIFEMYWIKVMGLSWNMTRVQCPIVSIYDKYDII